MTTPPRLATWLLQRRLHPDERDELIGDLHEEYRLRIATAGPVSADRWYWRETLALAWGFTLQRRDVVSASHERRRGAWMLFGVALDWRDATRSLRHSPAFALIAMLTIAFGIGLSTIVFSLVDGILLTPLPYAGADRLVRLSETPAQGPLASLAALRPSTELTGGELADTTIGQWKAHGETLDAIVPTSTTGENVALRGGVEQLIVGTVGGQFFDTLAITAVAGRVLQIADDQREAPAVAVVSARLAARLGPDPAGILGSTLVVENEALSIVGVVPAIDFPEPNIDIWRAGRWRWPPPGAQRQFGMSLDVFGRMRPGVTVDAVQREGEKIVADIAAAHPDFFDGNVAVPRVRVRRLLDDLVAPVRPALVVLSTGMALVLLAACVNLAHLVLTRTTARRRDVAVRLALGASGARIARPLLFEQLVLAAGGSAAGALLAWWGLRSLPAIAPADLPRLGDIRFSLGSLLFAGTAAFATACVAGVLPVWRLAGRRRAGRAAVEGLRTNVQPPSTDRFRSLLVVAQVALAVVLLVGAALVGRSLMSLLRVNPGFDPEGVIGVQVSMPSAWWRQTGRFTNYMTELVAQVSARPGVLAVGTTSVLPLHGLGSSGTFWRLDRPKPAPGEFPAATYRVISPGYLAAIGTPVLRGRGVLPTDTMDAERVALIDEVAAARYYAGEDPVGLRVHASGPREWTIVGVVAAVHERGLSNRPIPTLYFPSMQMPELLGFGQNGSGLAVRSSGDPLAIVPYIRQLSSALEPDWPIFNVSLMTDRASATVAQPRFYTLTLGVFALLALSTAVLGVYGVLAYAVERRRLEFSIRRALGATEHEVLRLVLGRGLGLGAAGLTLGLLMAAGGSSLLRSQLFGIGRFDPVSFTAAATLLVAVVLAASWLPARRAMRTDPAHALKSE